MYTYYVYIRCSAIYYTNIHIKYAYLIMLRFFKNKYVNIINAEVC